MTATSEGTRFLCRRIGHANLAVSSIERSSTFYQEVAGLTLVFRVDRGPQLFFSNGNTHHDIAMTPVNPRPDALVNEGRWRPVRQRPGVNHVGLELASQMDLARARQNALEHGARILGVMNHTISWGLYVSDPEENQLELYSDSFPTWREFFHEHMGEGIGKLAEPPAPAAADGQHIHGPYPPADPPPNALVRPQRLSSACLRAANVTSAAAFYRDVIGLTALQEQGNDGVLLAGSEGNADIHILPARAGEDTGFFRLCFDLRPGELASATKERLRQRRLHPIEDHKASGRFMITDPDGLELEFRETGEG